MLRQALDQIHKECVEQLSRLGTSRLMANIICDWCIDISLVVVLSILTNKKEQHIEDKGELFEEQSNYWGE